MKALMHIDKNTRKVLNRQIQEAVNAEQHDVATRALYLVLLACWQAGLSPRTLRRVQAALTPVTEKYSEYRTDQLADLWAQVTLQAQGFDVEETEEKL